MTFQDSRKRKPRRKTKDRVLQARIPEQLDEELRNRAEQLGLSVSTVVRNVLLNTFDLVESVVADSAQLAAVIKGRTAPAGEQQPGLPDVTASQENHPVIGWQEATLNRNGVCEHCNAMLPRGEVAGIGVPVTARPLLLCQPCLARLREVHDSESTPGDSQP